MNQAIETTATGDAGQDQKKKKAPWTMVMQIANAHSFSVGFVGIQLTHGYVAALALSSVSVIVGMIVSLIATKEPLWMAIVEGVPLGGVIAFVFDSMTLFGLKMVHESKGIKKYFAFALIGIGIALSTLAGDQMWSLVYKDWHGIVLAMSVSCVIVMVDVWQKEHDAAVKHASQQPDAMQVALNTEVEVVVDKKLRLYTHEQLNSPEMEVSLREQSFASVQQIVQSKFNQRLKMLQAGGTETHEESLPSIIESDPRALPAAGETTIEPVTESEQASQELPAQPTEIGEPTILDPQEQPTETSGRPNVVYADHRDGLIDLVARNAVPSVSQVAQHAGIPRSTMARWLAKAKRELERMEAEEKAEQDKQESQIVDADQEPAEEEGESEASGRLTFEQAETEETEEQDNQASQDDEAETDEMEEQDNQVSQDDEAKTEETEEQDNQVSQDNEAEIAELEAKWKAGQFDAPVDDPYGFEAGVKLLKNRYGKKVETPVAE